MDTLDDLKIPRHQPNTVSIYMSPELRALARSMAKDQNLSAYLRGLILRDAAGSLISK